MKTTLQSAQVLDSGFEILELADLTELDAVGVWARHRKSGAQVFHILTDDPENLFSFSFATIPEDSTGVAHILEHSVLCGSENYPLKDAFLVLAQGSLQTFLNAWTFPDKTLYPASSVNEQDYFNLMAVYGDAVFRPLLTEWTFLQEGHRLEFAPRGSAAGKEGEEGLSITGVVYNEMKGAYSSLDAYADSWSVKAVLPDTPYAFESGGDPEEIPRLTWENLKEFHRTRYSPANCRIFLAGNIPTEKQLAFLDSRFLSRLPPGEAAPPVPRARRWERMRTVRVPCPAGSERKATVFLSWLCGDATDSEETLALSVLAEILLGHDGSPLTRALIEAALGEDLASSSGLESEIRESLFVAGLQGVGEVPGGKGEAVEALILGELRRLVREGVPPGEIEAALLSLEFSHREICRAGGPFSLVWLRRSLRGWLHGRKPWESLLFVPAFTALKERIARDGRFFESLIEKYLLNNPHRALVVVEGEEGFLEKKEAALAEALEKQERSLSEEERRGIREKAAELERMQTEGDSAEALARIPHLSRQDLSGEIETVPRELRDARGVPALTHELFTNGIIYGELAFPLDVLSPEDYPWLPFFSQAITSLGLPGMDYGELSSLLARTAGGFHASLYTGSPAPGTGRTLATPSGILDLSGRDWLVYRFKALEAKTVPTLDLVFRLIREADFSDLRRIRDLVLEMKNNMDSSLAPRGHTYASCRSARSFSRASAVGEIWHGLEQLQFARTLAALDTAEISRTLMGLRDRIARGGLLINLTGSGEALDRAFLAAEERFCPFGPPRPRNSASAEAAPFLAFSGGAVPEGVPEVFTSPSLQVGFAAAALPAARYVSPSHAAELALSHWLSTGPLWEDIRMRGGAYGAFAHTDSFEGIFSFSTYRDPNPQRSLGAFGAALGEAATRGIDEEALVKTIIGTYSREIRPRTPAEKGWNDFFRFLAGVEDYHREKKLRGLIALKPGDLTGAAERLAGCTGGAPAVIIAGASAGEKAARALGAVVRELPV